MLSGEQKFEEIILNSAEWYEHHHITLHAGKRVTAINRAARKVMTEDSSETAYDRLILATGSRPFIPPCRGSRPARRARLSRHRRHRGHD